MNRKDFVLNIIINKLNLKDERIHDTNSLLAKFTFGDIKLDITTGRVNVADFGEGRSVEFASTLEELKNKLENTPFELTFLKPKKQNDGASKQTDAKDIEVVKDNKDTNKNDGAASQDENKQDEVVNESNDNDKDSDSKDVPNSNEGSSEAIGKVSVKWPPALIQKLTDHCTAVIPYMQVCDIKHEDEVVGTITLGIMLHCKCEDRPLSSKHSEPYINECGILTAFQNARKEMEKNDVFFVIGRNSEPCPDSDSIFKEPSPFLERQRYPIRLDTSKYKLIRGTLVKDCSPLSENVYGQQDFCVSWYQPEEKPNQGKPSDRKNNVYTCQDIFGYPKPNGEMRRHSIMKGGQTLEKNISRGHEKKTSFSERRSSSATRLNSMTRSTDIDTHDESENGEDTLTNGSLQQMLFDRLNTYRCGQEISKKTDVKNILPPRYCSKCCENLTLYPRRVPCPKCGYKPPSRFVHDDGETVDDIVNQWNSDEKTFIEDSGFSKYDHCTCHEREDRKFKRKCLYCRVRDLRTEVTDQGSPEEELFDTGRQRILSDSDITTDEDGKNMCDEILKMYGDDSQERNMCRDDESSPMLKQNLPKKYRLNFEKSRNPGKPRKSADLQSNENIVYSKLQKRITKTTKTMREPERELTPKPKPKTLRQLQKDMRRKHSRRYCYPKRKCIKKSLVSHDKCIAENHRVPPNMGWLWCCDKQALKRNWRPGKISRPIRELMQYFLRDFPVDSLPTTQELTNLMKAPLEPEPQEELVQKPTLRIQKQDGQFLVTMHPLKAKKELQYSADPCSKADPIQFIIAKDPLDMKRRQIKRYLKDIGFMNCICKQSIAKCNCRSYMEKERLDNSLKYICDLVQATSLRDAVCLSDTTDSESHMNIEFTPPAGVIKPHLMVKPDIAENCTQYEEMDYIPQFGKRTENIVKQEIKTKKRQYCEGPIQDTPCQPTPVVRKMKKGKQKPDVQTKNVISQSKKDIGEINIAPKERRVTKLSKEK